MEKWKKGDFELSILEELELSVALQKGLRTDFLTHKQVIEILDNARERLIYGGI